LCCSPLHCPPVLWDCWPHPCPVLLRFS
jgi:hypothetical protein